MVQVLLRLTLDLGSGWRVVKGASPRFKEAIQALLPSHRSHCTQNLLDNCKRISSFDCRRLKTCWTDATSSDFGAGAGHIGKLRLRCAYSKGRSTIQRPLPRHWFVHVILNRSSCTDPKAVRYEFCKCWITVSLNSANDQGQQQEECGLGPTVKA